MELVREREVISVMAVNFSGTEVAKILQGTFRAIARGDSRLNKNNQSGFQNRRQERTKENPPVVRMGLPSRKAR